MQTLTQIRELLQQAGLEPRRMFGQNFLIDGNLMLKLLDLAECQAADVLEVGPGTGSLTEELLRRARSVLAVEIDRDLAAVIRHHLRDRASLTILNCDVLDGKTSLSPLVLEALAGRPPVHLVSNLPYNVAVPVILNSLLLTWRSLRPAAGGQAQAPAFPAIVRLTFTVQRELVDRLAARPGSRDYGLPSIIVSLLARATPGRIVPATAFWPRPKVQSQMLRLDFDPARAAELKDAEALGKVIAACFAQRRKKIAAAAKLKDLPFPPERLLAALEQAGVSLDDRAEHVSPESFRAVANSLV